MTRLLALLAAAGLAGCATTEPPAPVVRTELRDRPAVPHGLLTCAGEPPVPGPAATQASVAGYVVDLLESGADCRRNLGAVRSILEPRP